MTIDLRRDHLARLLGDAVPDREVERILTGLGFLRRSRPPTAGRSACPTFRVDVRREADLIEEVGRHWGFDRIPATFPALRSVPRPDRARCDARPTGAAGADGGGPAGGGDVHLHRGGGRRAVRAPTQSSLVAIANPLSEKFAVLRPSLLPGLVDALVYNRRRETDDVRLFEAGSVFSRAGERQAVGWVHDRRARPPLERRRRSASISSTRRAPPSCWRAPSAPRSTAELADDVPWFVRGRAARLSALTPDALVVAGVIGEIRPDLAGRARPAAG